MRFRLAVIAALLAGPFCGPALSVAWAQMPTGPVAVGIVRAEKQPITETSQFIGRIQAINKVALVARVTGFLEKQAFVEGAEIHAGDLLYVLEQPPFQADLEAKKAAVQEAQAELANSSVAFQRQEKLLNGPAGQQAAYDLARALMLSDAGKLLAAQAQQKQSEINLGYTEIRSPIDGKIGRTTVTIGNVVSPTTGTLATITSQDPMYVTFPVPVRDALKLRDQLNVKGGFNSMVIRIRLPDGKLYDQAGKVDFEDNTISTSTDTLILRGTIPNPVEGPAGRELVDNEFVTVLLQGAEPVALLAIPRAAVLSDQQGDYVFTVGADNKVQEKRITLGQSSPAVATVLTGLDKGDMVIVDGIQKIHPGQVVQPGPSSPLPGMALDRTALR